MPRAVEIRVQGDLVKRRRLPRAEERQPDVGGMLRKEREVDPVFHARSAQGKGVAPVDTQEMPHAPSVTRLQQPD